MNGLLTHNNRSIESLSSEATTAGSAPTRTSNSTVRGIGSQSGRVLYAVGEAALRGIDGLKIRRRLGIISSTFPHNDLDPQDLTEIYDDVLELSRYNVYTNRIRKQAIAALLGQISTRQTRRLVEHLAKWPAVEIALLLSEIISCLPADWLPPDTTPQEMHRELRGVYMVSQVENSHPAYPIIKFIANLCKVSLTTCQGVLDSGFLDTLACIYACNLIGNETTRPLRFQPGHGDRNLRLLVRDGSSILTSMSHFLTPQTVSAYSVCALWPMDEQLRTLLNERVTRDTAWRQLGPIVISRRIYSLKHLLPESKCDTNAETNHLTDADIDLESFLRAEIYGIEISDEAKAVRSYCHERRLEGNLPEHGKEDGQDSRQIPEKQSRTLWSSLRGKDRKTAVRRRHTTGTSLSAENPPADNSRHSDGSLVRGQSFWGSWRGKARWGSVRNKDTQSTSLLAEEILANREDHGRKELATIIGYLDSTAPEHRSLVLGFCDRASACEASAKEAIRALSHVLKHGEPSAQLSAANLWAIMLENPSEPLMQQIMSPGLLDVLEEALTSPKTTPVVRERLMDVLAAVTYISGNDPLAEERGLRGLWLSLKSPERPVEGIPFNFGHVVIRSPALQTVSEEPIDANWVQSHRESNTLTPYASASPTMPSPAHNASTAGADSPPQQLTGNAEDCPAFDASVFPPPYDNSERPLGEAVVGQNDMNPSDTTTQERLLAALVASNKAHMDALSVYVDLQRAAIEKQTEEITRILASTTGIQDPRLTRRGPEANRTMTLHPPHNWTTRRPPSEKEKTQEQRSNVDVAPDSVMSAHPENSRLVTPPTRGEHNLIQPLPRPLPPILSEMPYATPSQNSDDTASIVRELPVAPVTPSSHSTSLLPFPSERSLPAGTPCAPESPPPSLTPCPPSPSFSPPPTSHPPSRLVSVPNPDPLAASVRPITPTIATFPTPAVSPLQPGSTGLMESQLLEITNRDTTGITEICDIRGTASLTPSHETSESPANSTQTVTHSPATTHQTRPSDIQSTYSTDAENIPPRPHGPRPQRTTTRPVTQSLIADWLSGCALANHHYLHK